MQVYADGGNYRLYQGSMLEMCPTIPENIVDAIVTDPPYELSDSSKRFQQVIETLGNIPFPNLNEANAEFIKQSLFSSIMFNGPNLGWVKMSGVVDCGVGVPEGPVDFDDSVVARDVEIADSHELPQAISDSPLPNVGDIEAIQGAGNYILDFGNLRDSAIRDSLRSCLRKANSGTLRLPVCTISSPSSPSLFTRSRIITKGNQFVGLSTDSRDEPSLSSDTTAVIGTALNTMLALELREGTGELSMANGTSCLNTLSGFLAPKLIGALPTASGLSAEFKPFGVRLVSSPTDRTNSRHITVWIQKKLLSAITPILAQKGGFMGKAWDGSDVSFQKETWEKCLQVLKPGGYLLAFGGTRTYHRIACAIEDAGFEIRDCIMWLYGSGFPKSMDLGKKLGSEWAGWGTCLKPSYEPIIVARKPFKGSLIDNVLTNGIGGLNIDECRVGDEQVLVHNAPKGTFAGGEPDRGSDTDSYRTHQGRFPANVTHDGSEEACANMPNNSSRYFYCAKASKRDRDEGLDGFEAKDGDVGALRDGNRNNTQPRRNSHCTVKPTALMQYLIRLVAPKGSLILDPFMGSGSTGKAVMYENKDRDAHYKFLGIELTEEYLPIAEARIKFARGDNAEG